MKLVTYLKDEHEQLAAYIDGYLYDMEVLHPDLPNTMSVFLNYWEESLPMALGGEIMGKDGDISQKKGVAYDSVQLFAPLPFPTSYRDGYSFRQHVSATRKNGGDVMPAFDQYPVFYFGNHHSIQGAGNINCMPDHFEQLDFELEVAIVICKHGRNIRAADADAYIGGLMILNDFSARRLQKEEMLFNLGPSKAKDFATATGPWLVTLNELEAFETTAKENHTGKSWNLSMQCRINETLIGQGNISDMHWTFAELIERASYGADLHPGDIIASGTVGSGCLLELNIAGKASDANYTEQWLKEDDTVELEVEGLGILSNTIVKEDDDFSLLAIKK